VQLAQRATDGLELGRLEALGMQHLALMKTEHRNAFMVEVAVITAHPILHRMRAGERMLAQEAQQIEFALELVFTLDLVDAQQKASFSRLQQVIAIDRTLGNTLNSADTAQAVIIGEFLQERFRELGINGHLIGDEVSDYLPESRAHRQCRQLGGRKNGRADTISIVSTSKMN
jgi:hypothetical protein